MTNDLDPQAVNYANANHVTYSQAVDALAARGYSGSSTTNWADKPGTIYTGEWTGDLTGYPGQQTGTMQTRGGLVNIDTGGGQTDTRVPTLRSYNQQLNWFAQQLFNNTPYAKSIEQQMIAIGVIPNGATFQQVMGAYESNAVRPAYNMGVRAQMTPDELLAWNLARKQAMPVTQTATETSTSVSRMSAADAKAAAENVSLQALGRRVLPGEQGGYASTVTALENANPQVTTATATTNRLTHHTDRSSTSTGGVSGAAIDEALLEQAMRSPEYGAYQAAGQFLPALLSRLGAFSSIGS